MASQQPFALKKNGPHVAPLAETSLFCLQIELPSIRQEKQLAHKLSQARRGPNTQLSPSRVANLTVAPSEAY